MTTLNRPGTPDAHSCGIDAAMEVIGGKWKVLILWALEEHARLRFGEMRRLVPGITEKVLASHLREMEADGVVLRVSYDEVPPRVEYALTEDGRRLNEALGPLADWGRGRRVGRGPAAAQGVAPPDGPSPHRRHDPSLRGELSAERAAHRVRAASGRPVWRWRTPRR